MKREKKQWRKQTNKQKIEQNVQELWGNFKGITYTWLQCQKEKKNRTEISDVILAKNFAKLMTYQTTDLGILEDTRLDKYQTNTQTKTNHKQKTHKKL